VSIKDYAKLRPETEIEQCDCATISEIYLVYTLTRNPIHCAECRGPIDPERLQLSAKEVGSIAQCFSVYDALYDLWLDSGEYEAYAKEKLLDPLGQVNQAGLALAEALSDSYPTYYWWFHDAGADGEPTQCPACHGALDRSVRWAAGKCEACRVVV